MYQGTYGALIRTFGMDTMKARKVQQSVCVLLPLSSVDMLTAQLSVSYFKKGHEKRI